MKILSLLPALLLVAMPVQEAPNEQEPSDQELREMIIVPSDTTPITVEEMEQRFSLCIMYVTGQTDPAKIVEIYELDTARKRRDWEMACQLTAMGVDVGYRAAEQNRSSNGRNYLNSR